MADFNYEFNLARYQQKGLINTGAPVHFLTHEFRPFTGGIGVYIEEMARACAAGGANTIVWAPDYGFNTGDAEPFTVNRIRMRGKQDWICRWRMGRSFGRHFPDGRLPGTIVLAEPGPIRWWMYRSLTRPPRPERLVLIFHGTELRQLTALSHSRFLLGKLMKAADQIGVVSDEIGKLLLKVYTGARNKMVRVPGAVRSVWRDEPASGYENRRKELIHVGRIHPRKGQLALVQAMAMLPGYLRDAYTVRLIGPVARPAYAEEIRKASRMNRVHLEFNGVLNEADLMKAYRRASLAVMSSQRYKSSIEGLGIALLEAQHFGCAVIGSDMGGVREAMNPGESGLLVPAGDIAALANAIRQLIENPGLAQAFGSNGAAFVRQHFSWARNVHQLRLA